MRAHIRRGRGDGKLASGIDFPRSRRGQAPPSGRLVRTLDAGILHHAGELAQPQAQAREVVEIGIDPSR
jgi:hypothetical protein